MSNKAYKQIFKSTSIIGGAQVINILIGLIRSKFIAVLLGPAGYGISGLLSVPLTFITNITGFGIGFSAVRDVSIAHEEGDVSKLNKTLLVLRRWMWITGSFGMICTIILAPWLSQWSFGSKEYTWAFIWLSITILINSLRSGYYSALRGTRKIKESALATVYGSLIGLFTSLPLYYCYGVKGIVPALIVSAISTLVIYKLYGKRVKSVKTQISYRETFFHGKKMAQLGIVMIIGGLFIQLVNYLVNIFISRYGSVSDVGLYNAGWAITNHYVDLVFTAMWADFYPRLAGLSRDYKAMGEAVNQQSEIAVLIIGPLMIFYLLSLPILIPIFYSKEFLPILAFTQWIVLGMLFKALSGAMGTTLMATGKSKLYLLSEFTISALTLIFNVYAYYTWGLKGMGISFTIIYVVYFVIIYFIVRRSFSYRLSNTLMKVGFIQLMFIVSAFLLAYLIDSYWVYVFGSCILFLSATFSLYEINKRIEIKPIAIKLLTKLGIKEK